MGGGGGGGAIIELFLIDFHCHTKLQRKLWEVWDPINFFYIFEAPGLHFCHFLKQIYKQITF